MTGDRAKDDQVVRLVRQHLSMEENCWQEPDEPLPQDCCGQSCIPCVFDIHRKDLVEWAKEVAKQIKHGEGNLYNFVYGEEVDVNSNKETILSQYSFLEITNITSLTKDTFLYSFAVRGLRLPLGAHLRASARLHIIAKRCHIARDSRLGHALQRVKLRAGHS